MPSVLRPLRRLIRKWAPGAGGPKPPAPCAPANLDAELRALELQRQTSPRPHEVNAQMNELERQAGREELRSYPVYAAVNLIGACNARCRFCYYGDSPQDRSVLRLADVRRMPWLRFLSTLDLYGGLGEPLLLDDFPAIVDWLRQQNPSQRLHTTSNGSLLTPALSQRLAGRLSLLNISINAATPETYENLMIGLSWSRLMENIERFQEINQAQQQPTELTFSYVCSRANVAELPKLAEIARRLGVKTVGVSHFCVNGVWEKRQREQPRLSRQDTLYFHRELFDRGMDEAEAAFQRAGVPFGHPPRFAAATKIGLGGRMPAGRPDAVECFAPWQTVYVNPHQQGKWVSCCCSVNADHHDLTPLDLDDTDFLRTWNSDVFRLMRREVNRRPCPLINCQFCRRWDKSSPEASVPQLEMTLASTRQYHQLLGRPMADSVEESLADRRQRIEELQAGENSL